MMNRAYREATPFAGKNSTGASNAIDLYDVEFGAYGHVGLQISGTFVATVDIQVSADGTNYVNYGSAITVPGATQLNLLGWKRFRLNVSAYTSGSIDASVFVVQS